MENILGGFMNKNWLGLKTHDMVLNAAPIDTEVKPNTFGNEYDETGFWEKIKRYAKQIGKKGVEKLLILYYCVEDSDTPKWVKTVIIGTLGYFIVPLDAIPDFTPVLGFNDDLGVVLIALGWVAVHIKQEHKDKAHEILRRWFD